MLKYSNTVDSFEILEQTVIKQKRLAKKKKCDLRLRILLKRTFDLVCEIMDRENGFDDDYIDISKNSSKINNDYSNYSDSKNENTENNVILTSNLAESELEAIPLPAGDYDSCINRIEECVQMVPDEQSENLIKYNDDNNKEYHMLTNVQNDYFLTNYSNNNEVKSCKRKFDDFSIQFSSNNKKPKFIDVNAKVNKINEA